MTKSRRLYYSEVAKHDPCTTQAERFKALCGKKGYVTITEAWMLRP